MTPTVPTTSGPAPGPVATAAASLLTTAAVAAALGRAGAGSRRLERTNFHGRTVSLRGGVGVAAGATAAGACAGGFRYHAGEPVGAAAIAAVTAVTAAGTAGLVDDLDAGAHDGAVPAKGLKGHLAALRRGHVTTGALKVAVIGGGALVAGGLLAHARRHDGAARAVADAATGAVVIASWANLHNLLDLRPGRALKAAVLASAPLLADRRPESAASRALAAGALGAAAAALPEDLGETTMLGDTGANALGALVGAALAAHPSRPLRAAAGITGTGLVLASERISFTRVIENHPLLSAVDRLGRRAP
ncbi:hypothetical protein SAMN05216355_10992 [Actinomyces ruminicola]|uniref:UDP-N-acetylmuramyl pentapeptide phosphotransferase/UDP-N-acetylglucosamine-1-phosphate transferase n=1 Tax=Actinomyces ruminicola TaxID=332524 RepID=A0A1H0D950_9ACTO|nr:hypothetical protein [Actinomyces ruminicola]SDN66628.1 hypothetical protein SAMN05216355_10992 [Actinomyces ruminicola]